MSLRDDPSSRLTNQAPWLRFAAPWLLIAVIGCSSSESSNATGALAPADSTGQATNAGASGSLTGSTTTAADTSGATTTTSGGASGTTTTGVTNAAGSAATVGNAGATSNTTTPSGGSGTGLTPTDVSNAGSSPVVSGSGGLGSTGGTSTGGMLTGGASIGGIGVGGANTGGASLGSGAGGAMASAGAAGLAGAASVNGGSGGSGNNTGGDFDPCPSNGDPCKLLPLGDSITDGLGVPGGGSYRIELFSLALADSKSITYVGGSMNGPTMVDGQPFPRAHEGHSGWTIQQIDDIVPSPALNGEPHIILLHIGTNDMYQTPTGASERLGTLIDQILESLPDSLLVVSSIIPFPGADAAVSSFNATIPGLVETRAAAGEHILFVDQYEGFPTGELADGVHPNEAGYARMAARWYPAIASYLH